MTAGRKPKPTELKLLTGNPGKRAVRRARWRLASSGCVRLLRLSGCQTTASKNGGGWRRYCWRCGCCGTPI